MTQKHHLKMAVISNNNKYVQPQAYFGVAGGVLSELKLDSGSLSAQVENWSRLRRTRS